MCADGYFPRGESMLRKVHEERLVGLFFGQRALCIGALAPLNYVGTSDHSAGKLTPFKRLARTGNAFESIFFGDCREADKVLAYVTRMHGRVHGALPEDAGVTPAGTPYDAFDPALMLWTVAVIADSAERFYELFIRRLTGGEREALWQDYLRFGELFGMPRAECPQSYREFRRYWHDELGSERMFLTEEARYVGHATAFEIPLPRARQPGKWVHDAIMLGSLPPRVRELYGMTYGRREAAEFEAGVRALRAARRVAPRPLTRGRNTRSFNMVAATEARRIERGEWTPQIREGQFSRAPQRREAPTAATAPAARAHRAA
jgi:uncharacterized protein (DUF2236 family)